MDPRGCEPICIGWKCGFAAAPIRIYVHCEGALSLMAAEPMLKNSGCTNNEVLDLAYSLMSRLLWVALGLVDPERGCAASDYCYF
jgi:hypothetical protein